MRSRITHRIAVRLASFVALIVTATNIAIFAALYFTISAQMMAQLRAHINEVRETLADIETTNKDGLQALAAMVDGDARVAPADEDIYLLVDKTGKRVAGNISSLERFEGWRTIPWEDLKLLGSWSPRRSSDAVIGRWTDVQGGSLFVGDGNGDIRDTQRLLLNGMVWGIGLSIVCAVLGGWLLGLRAQKRILEIEEALHAVAAGALDRRVPRGSAADDIEHVAILINATLDRLQRLFANLKQVSVDIAHDLRTPISRMRQKLETVRSGPDNLEAYKGATDASIEEIDNIAETFDALLRISEIEAGARKNKFLDIELNSLLENITDAMEAVADERRHQLHITGQDVGPVHVRGDRKLLNQLFVNLIENAMVHCADPAGISVELLTISGRPTVRVRDTGPGIPEEEREKVFRRLYRLERSRSTPGNGLGLSLVAAIAELHGAAVTLADNAPGLIVEVQFRQS